MADNSFAQYDLYPAYKNDNIPVVFVSDENYLPYLKIAIRSMIQNCKQGNLDIFVFHEDIPGASQEDFLACFHEANVSIRFVSVADVVRQTELGQVQTVSYFTQAASYRLIIADLLVNYDKVIYLDIDLIIAGDIGELYRTDLKGAWIGACRGIGYPDFVSSNKKRRLWNIENCNIPPEEYFNSGILLIDCAAFRSYVSSHEMFHIAANSPFFPDQDALNIACRGHVHFLDMKWNVQVGYCCKHLDGFDGEQYLALLSSAAILHYSTGKKPWKQPSSFMADTWWSYVKEEERSEFLGKNRIEANSSQPIRLHYYGFRPNFGDSLSRTLVETLSGKPVRYSPVTECDIMGVGSIFGDGQNFFSRQINTPNSPCLHIWGSGFLHPQELEGPVAHTREVIVHACRGKETLQVLKKAGLVRPGEEPVLGDPGLLYPDIVTGSRDLPKEYDLSLVPHWKDFDACTELARKLEEKGIEAHIINVSQDNPADVIREIARSRKIISSSMHGIIVADSLGIANKRLIFSQFFNDEQQQFEQSFFKFRDYYSAFDVEPPAYITDAELAENPEGVIASMGEQGMVPLEKIEACKKKLLAAFPFGEVSEHTWAKKAQRRLSVIIPVYNVEQYLNECLSSLLSQKDFIDMEVICIDDGSADGSRDILEQWRRRDERLQIVCQENSGPGTARNKAMELARGDYIMFLDADDRISSGKALQAAFQQAVRDDLDVLVADACNMTVLGTVTKSSYIDSSLLPEEKVFKANTTSLQQLVLKNLAPWAKIFKRSFVESQKLAFLPISRSEDFPFVYLAIVCADRLGVMTESLVDHRLGLATSLESTKDKTPLIFTEAEAYLHDQLKSRGLYETHGDYARLRACTRFAWNINAMKTYEGFLELYNASGSFFAEYALDEESPLAKDEDYIKAKTLIREIIKSETPESWVFQSLRVCRASVASASASASTENNIREVTNLRNSNKKLLEGIKFFKEHLAKKEKGIEFYKEHLAKKEKGIAYFKRELNNREYLLNRKIVKFAVKLYKAFMKLRGKK